MEYINNTVTIVIIVVSTVVIVVLAKLFISRQRLARMVEIRTRKDGTKYPISKGSKQYSKDYSDKVATTGEYRQVLEGEGHKTKSVDDTYICLKDSAKDDEVLVRPITVDGKDTLHCPLCGSSELQKQ